MPSMPRDDRAKLNKILRLTRDHVDDALEALDNDGRLSRKQRADLKLAERNTAQLLAHILDGQHYNTVPWSTVEQLWEYGQLAADILEEDGAPVTDDTVKLPTGRYRVTRQLADKRKSVECANPAYGSILLDIWESSATGRSLAP